MTRRSLLLSIALLGGCGDDVDPDLEPRTSEEHAAARRVADVPNVLLLTLDTTRADALSCYGGPPGLTPNFDQVAGRSVLYENARTVTPLTLPAHSSMLTGLYPPRHGVRENGLYRLPNSARTLAEVAEELGVQSAAFVGAAVLDQEFGIAQGFGHYDQPEREGASHVASVAERPARVVTEQAVSWLNQRNPDQPFFLWVHYFDPHQPLTPPRRFEGPAQGKLYWAEVAYTDEQFGRVLQSLAPVLHETAVVIVGDHGEGLSEHDEPTHGGYCYDSTLRVPFLVHHPDDHRAGERSREVVSVVDVFPTILNFWGVHEHGDVDGRDLRAAVPEDRGVYFESWYGYLNLGWGPVSGWATREGKYIHSSDPEYYETDQDPQELDDLIAEKADAARRARDSVAALIDKPVLPRDGDAVDPAMLERLRQLGYAAIGSTEELPSPLAELDLLDPRSHAEEYLRFLSAIQHGSRGEFEEATEILEAILVDNPRHAAARTFVSAYLIQTQRFERARAVLEEMHELGFEQPTSHYNLGLCYERAGEHERAFAHYQRTRELDPSHVSAGWAIQRLEQSLGLAEDEDGGPDDD